MSDSRSPNEASASPDESPSTPTTSSAPSASREPEAASVAAHAPHHVAQQTLVGIAPSDAPDIEEPASSEPHTDRGASTPSSTRKAKGSGGTLIGVPAPSILPRRPSHAPGPASVVPSASGKSEAATSAFPTAPTPSWSPGAASSRSIPVSRPPANLEDEEDWDAAPTIKPSSTPPATSDTDEEGWDSEAPTAITTSKLPPAMPTPAATRDEVQPIAAAAQEQAQQAQPPQTRDEVQPIAAAAQEQAPQARPPAANEEASSTTSTRADAEPTGTPSPREASPTSSVASIATQHGVTSTSPLTHSGPIVREPNDVTPRKNTGKRTIALLIAAVALGALALFMRQKAEHTQAPSASHLPTAAPQPREAEPQRAANEAEPRKAESAAASEPAAAASGATAQAAPLVPAVVTSSTPTKPESADVIVVTVNTVPPDARFFYKGKPVGRAPFRVELKPGERRSFEIGRAGYFARKVVVDGSKREMKVTMRPEH